MLRALDKLVNSEEKRREEKRKRDSEVAVAVGLAFDVAGRARFARAMS